MAEISRDFEPQGGIGEPGYETIDLKLSRVWIAGILLILVSIGTFGLTAWMMRQYRGDEREIESQRPPLFADDRGLYPEPRLQENPSADLIAMRKADRAELAAYGWVDRKAGLVKIPIERAMEILARKGLPLNEKEVSTKTDATKMKPESASPTVKKAADTNQKSTTTQGGER